MCNFGNERIQKINNAKDVFDSFSRGAVIFGGLVLVSGVVVWKWCGGYFYGGGGVGGARDETLQGCMAR